MCRVFLPHPANQGATEVFGAIAAVPAGLGVVAGGTEFPDEAE
jgi:hypothetical protein